MVGARAATAAGTSDVQTGSGLHPSVDDRPDAAPRRQVDAWDVVGLLTTAAVALGIHQSGVIFGADGLGRSRVVSVTSLGIAVGAAIGLAVVVSVQRPRLRVAARHLVQVWTDPPGHWVAFVLGGIIAVPILSLYAPVIFEDADSARIVAAVNHVQTHGLDFLRETQENFLPHLVLGPLMWVGGLAAAKLYAVVSVQILAGTTAYITRRLTGSMGAAAASAVALLALSSVTGRAVVVPLYPTMLALGYLGCWLTYESVVRDGGPWPIAIAAGLCLALAPEAQPVGVLFLPIPLFMAIFGRGMRPTLAALGRVYGTVVVASLPRLAMNLSVDGFDHLTSYRTDYWITKGYVSEIQTTFWHYLGVDEPLGEYLLHLPGRFVSTLGGGGWIVLGAAVAAWIVATNKRTRFFILGVAGYFTAALVVKQIPPFPRYYSPAWPGIAILVGAGVAALVRRRTAAAHWVAAGVVATCAVLGVVNLRDLVADYERLRSRVEAEPYHELAALVDDGKGVIGARSHALLNVTADIPVWGGQFLSEDEYVTFLSWPSDADVVAMMRDHDIGWVLIHRKRELETTYHNTWLVPHHGTTTQHVKSIAASPNFCLRAESDGYLLYELGPCTVAGAPASPPPAHGSVIG